MSLKHRRDLDKAVAGSGRLFQANFSDVVNARPRLLLDRLEGRGFVGISKPYK